MRRFIIKNINKKLYTDMLTYICKQCKDFEVVEIGGRYYKELPEIKTKLRDYCIGYRNVNKWAGTRASGGQMHVYVCSNASIDILKTYKGFFNLDSDGGGSEIDVCFYKKGLEFLFTTSHEYHIEGIYDYWEQFFSRKMQGWGDYTMEIRSMLEMYHDGDDKDRSNLKPVK